MAILHIRSLIAAIVLLSSAAVSAEAWTDEPPQAGRTRVRAVHLTEVGAAVNARLASCGLPGAAAPSPGAALRAADFNAARASVNALFAGFSRPMPNYSDGPTLAPGGRVRLVHLTELRAAVDSAASWPCPAVACVPNGSCSAAEPACEATTSGWDNCANPCTKSGQACACVPNGSCSAAEPACEATTSGLDNCANPCTKNGQACACMPNGSCSAAEPACGTTTNGRDNCDNACSKTGRACASCKRVYQCSEIFANSGGSYCPSNECHGSGSSCSNALDCGALNANPDYCTSLVTCEFY